MRYFEDIEIGETATFGEYDVTETEVVEFATQYDPQFFHTDAEAAKESAFGEIVASGWHTAAICMRMYVDGFLRDCAAMGGYGIDELRWRRPVTPGDTLSLRTEVVDKHPSENTPRRGYVDHHLEGLNEDEAVVISFTALHMIERRTAGE